MSLWYYYAKSNNNVGYNIGFNKNDILASFEKFISSFDKDDSYYDFYYATDNKEIQNSLKVED